MDENGNANLFHKKQYMDQESSQAEMDDEADQSCGFSTYRPAWMQVFNNSKFLLALVSACAFIQSFAVNGINSVNTTTYERRFGLKSSQVGLISSSYDISAGILVLPITYYALNRHKHVMLAVAAGFLSLGSFVMWLVHFTTGLYEYELGSSDICTDGNVTTCVANSANSDQSFNLYIMMLGQFLHGVGGTTFYTVGITCMDDCVSAKSAPIYVAIFYASSALGPAIGYLLGGYLLDTYVDFDQVSTDLTAGDPRWVGAWWLGFVISMILAVILVLPFLGLPREIRGTQEIKAARVSEAHGDSDLDNLGTSFKDFPKVTWSLLKNPTFIFITLAACSEAIAVSGYTTFLPKFIQNQFGQPAGFSAILTGLIAVPGATGGYLIGGYVCRRFQLTIPGIARLCAFSCTLSLAAVTIMWAKCDGTKIAGVNTAYNNSSLQITTSNLQESCNYGCGCTQESYSPVCGSNGLQYFSACHAGCTQADGNNYKSCACINSTLDRNQTVTDGVCSTSCPMIYVFAPIFFVVMITTFLSGTLVTTTTLRCVKDSHKTFAVGIQWVPARFLGLVPGPILFGVIIDSACSVWKTNCGTGENESCWIYDDFAMGKNFFLAGVSVKFVSILLYLTTSFVYKPPREVTDVPGDSLRNNEPRFEMTSPKVKCLNGNTKTPIEGIDNPGLEL